MNNSYKDINTDTYFPTQDINDAYLADMKVNNTTASVHAPLHYNKGDIECIDAIKASMSLEEFAGYCKGNVEKYVWRYKYKDGLKDLEKATVYLRWLSDTELEIKASGVLLGKKECTCKP